MHDLPAVEIVDCSLSYGSARALKSVTFSVPQGSVFGLLGPNGSGKTSLFRILATLLPPDRGSAHLFGINVAQRPVDARRQLGVVFQDQSLDRRLSVEENLTHHGHMYGLRGRGLRGRISEVLARVGLEDRRADRVHTLSGGLRRRADLAKSLLHRPRLLLLDEPSTGVDPAARMRFWSCLRELQQTDGVTVLLTTHLLEEADACDRLAIFDAGRLVREGSPGALKSDLQLDVVTISTRAPEAVTGELKDEFGIDGSASPGTGVRFEHRDGTKWIPLLMERFGERIESVKVSRPSLEDVFLHHTGHGFETDGLR